MQEARKKHAPKATHVDFLEPGVLGIKGVKVVLHDEADVTDAGDVAPGKVAPDGAAGDTDEGDEVGDPPSEASAFTTVFGECVGLSLVP